VILGATTTIPLSCLLIDGDQAVAAAISRALEAAGMRVVGTAISAARGLELLETRQADVAVVDRQLPDMDGIELAVAISRSPSPARTLLCSGDADPAVAAQALAAGVNGLITSGSPAAEVVRARARGRRRRHLR
jgi:DNA-binding NarL/FixJ family response regulator